MRWVPCEAAGKKFGVKVGRMHDNPVGPHPRGSCQLTIETNRLAEVLPWLVLNRGKFTVFTHAQTGNALKDHTQHVVWLGPVRDAEARSVSLSGIVLTSKRARHRSVILRCERSEPRRMRPRNLGAVSFRGRAFGGTSRMTG